MNLAQYTVEDFLTDDSFVNYCLRNNAPDIVFWERWIIEHPERKKVVNEAVTLFSTLNGGWTSGQLEQDYSAFGLLLQEHVASKEQQKPVKKFSSGNKWIAAAAILAILLFTMLFYFKGSLFTDPSFNHLARQDIRSGSNSATLTLGNGETIDLAKSGIGSLANQPGVSITKTADGSLVYTPALQDDKTLQNTINKLETPRGGQHQIILPDGSKVWINAASVIKFPASFANASTRRIELTGEAYFEIAKNKDQPFIVQGNNQTVEVLGTHFNVDSYQDAETKTALLEGSVKISFAEHAPVVLKPGQQSIVSRRQLKVVRINVHDAMAWKDGFFVFDQEPLDIVMQKIARWYDVEIAYENESLKKILFGGTLNKYSMISKVLSKLELTREVQFRIEGRKVTVLEK